LRNANGGESSGPLAIEPPLGCYTDDHLGSWITWHLGVLVLGFCIGGPSSGTCCGERPERLRRGCAGAAQRLPPKDARLFYQNNIKGWGPALCAAGRDDMDMVDAFLNKMYRTNADFVFTVTRDFVRSCQSHIGPADDVPAHPTPSP